MLTSKMASIGLQRLPLVIYRLMKYLKSDDFFCSQLALFVIETGSISILTEFHSARQKVESEKKLLWQNTYDVVGSEWRLLFEAATNGRISLEKDRFAGKISTQCYLSK